MNREIRAAFPAARQWTYLNSAAIGPMPETTVNAIAAELLDATNNASVSLAERVEAKRRVRGLVAAALSAKTDDIAFTRNTSDGLCAVSAGMNWKPGDNIVSFENEFPANFYPWRSVRDRYGVELRLSRQVNGKFDEDELLALIDGRTRLVAISAVQYATGYKADLERIGKAARSQDALFAVDIIQAFGAMPIDLPTQYVDIAAGAGYKWLCGPEGCGIFYLNSRARERVACLSNGWMGVRDPWDFCDREQPYLEDARKWETGMGGTALLCGLEASLKMLLEIGIDRIEGHLTELTEFLCEILPPSRYEVVSARGPCERSQIVAIRPLSDLSADEIAGRLLRERICVSSRCGLLRIAPHLFNDLEDIERLVDALP